jgi:hypothetical protein
MLYVLLGVLSARSRSTSLSIVIIYKYDLIELRFILSRLVVVVSSADT